MKTPGDAGGPRRRRPHIGSVHFGGTRHNWAESSPKRRLDKTLSQAGTDATEWFLRIFNNRDVL